MNYLRPANALELFVAVQGTQSAKLRLLLRAFLIFWWLCDFCGTCTHICSNLNVTLEFSLKVFLRNAYLQQVTFSGRLLSVLMTTLAKVGKLWS